MKEHEKKYTSTTVYFQSKYKPEEVWEFLTHTKYTNQFEKGPCSYNKIDENFKLKKAILNTLHHL